MKEIAFSAFPVETVKLYCDRVYEIDWKLSPIDICQLLEFIHSLLQTDDEREVAMMKVHLEILASKWPIQYARKGLAVFFPILCRFFPDFPGPFASLSHLFLAVVNALHVSCL